MTGWVGQPPYDRFSRLFEDLNVLRTGDSPPPGVWIEVLAFAAQVRFLLIEIAGDPSVPADVKISIENVLTLKEPR